MNEESGPRQLAGGPDLEQQLVFHDPLHRLDEKIIELQSVPQLLPEFLETGIHSGYAAWKACSGGFCPSFPQVPQPLTSK